MTGRIFQTVLAAILVFCATLISTSVFGAATNPVVVPDHKAAIEDARNWAIVTNALQQMRQESSLAFHASEKARLDADAAIKQTAEATKARLNQLEQSLPFRAQPELEAIKDWNRFILIVGASLGGLGLLGLGFTAYFVMRTMHRLADVMSVLGTGRSLEHPRSPAALGVGGPNLDHPNPAEQSSAHFQAAMERLEKQIHALEQIARLPAGGDEAEQTPVGSGKGEVGSGKGESGDNLHTSQFAVRTSRIELMLGKAQALLNLKQPAEALTVFDEVLALDPQHHEALVKRGTALERLDRLDEALDSYDRAIAADQTFTTAYLCKGGVFNRLGRHDEALRCYEQALRTQEKAGMV